MEIILRKIFIHNSDPSKKYSTGYRALQDAELVTATANAASWSTLHQISEKYNWRYQQLLTASKKVNKRKKLAIIESVTPSLILVPKCVGHEDSSRFVDEMIESIYSIKCQILSVTHFAFAKSFDVNLFKTLIKSIKGMNEFGCKVVYVDIEASHYEIALDCMNDE
jgi:hypothetical protein